MKPKRGQKADNAVRNPLARFRQALIGIERRVGVLVEPTAEALRQPFPGKPGQIGARQIVRVEIPRPDELQFAGELNGELFFGGGR